MTEEPAMMPDAETFQEITRKATILIDLVHDCEEGEPFVFSEEQISTRLKGKMLGYYFPSVDGEPAFFHVWRGNWHPLLSTIRAVAHHLAKMLGDDAIHAVAKEAMKTATCRRMLAIGGPYAAEMIEPHGLFARAYAQHVVVSVAERLDEEGRRLDTEGLEEVERMLRTKFERLGAWPSKDFAAVRAVLIEQLHLKEWIMREGHHTREVSYGELWTPESEADCDAFWKKVTAIVNNVVWLDPITEDRAAAMALVQRVLNGPMTEGQAVAALQELEEAPDILMRNVIMKYRLHEELKRGREMIGMYVE
jgi:hypothetical protein